MPETIYELSNSTNLLIVKDFMNDMKNKKYIIVKVVKEVVAEDDPFGGYDTGQRIMTIFYRVNKNKEGKNADRTGQ